MATVTEFVLGERVAFSKTLSRVTEHPPGKDYSNKRWDYVESPWLPAPAEKVGVIVGVRVLSNGSVSYDGDGFSHYAADDHFTAYVIAYDLRRAHVLVQPEDIKHLDRTELF